MQTKSYKFGRALSFPLSFPASPNVMEVGNVQVIRAERTVKESEAMTRTDTGEDSLHKDQQSQKKQKQ